MATRKPSGLRDKIIEKTYHQCLKLLNPECHEFNRHTHNGTLQPFAQRESAMLTASGGGVLHYVQVGAFPLRDYTRLTQLPALYIVDGASSPDSTSSRNRRLGQAILQKTFEVYPLTLRVVVHQEIEPEYPQSNPVQLARIREQLDYFLDVQGFKGMTDKPFGYNLPSNVEAALITDGESLKGIATPWEIKDFEFEIIFTRQQARNHPRG